MSFQLFEDNIFEAQPETEAIMMNQIHRRTGTIRLGGGGRHGDLLARKLYAMPKCESVKIGVKTHSFSQFIHIMIPKIVIFKAYIINQSII